MLRRSSVIIIVFSCCAMLLHAQWTTPVILAPAQNSKNQSLTPTVRWTSQPGLIYNINVSRYSDFHSLVVSMSVRATAENSDIILGGLDAANTYYVRIRATGSGMNSSWSVTRSFTTVDVSNLLPMTVAPVNDATGQRTKTTLQWQDFPGAVSYDVEVSPTPQFSVIAFAAYGTVETHALTTVLSPSFRYYWHAKVHMDSYDGPWSAPSTFTTGAAPISPMLLLPEHESYSTTSDVEFRWQSAGNATRYHFQLARMSTFQNVLVDDTNVTTTSYTATVGVEDLLFWRVSAMNDIGEGTWSAWRSIHGMHPEMSADAPAQLLNISVQPNPVANLATFRYTVPAPGHVSLIVRDIQGTEIVHAALPHETVGTYDTPIDISDLAIGVYVYEVRYNNITHQGKLVIAR